MSGGGTNTVESTTVPSWLQPYLTSNLSQGQSLEAQGGPQMEQLVAPLNSMQNTALSDIQGVAGSPSAATSANSQLSNILSGQYLNPSSNPYLTSTYNTAAQSVQNSMDSQFGAAGRNIIASAPVQSDEDNNLANQIYGGAYQSGMQNMVTAAGEAPSVAQAQYLPGEEELQAGSGLQQQSQNVLNAQANEYNYQQALPYNTASWYSSLLGQNASPFEGTSSTSTAVTNPFLSTLGGASSGAVLGGALGGALSGGEAGSEAGPIGTGIGALAGGLMGYFS